MTLPIVLSAGEIAVYGPGDTSGTMPSGSVIPSSFVFGTVYNIWAGGETYVYGGDVVMWKKGSEVVQLATVGGTYTILPARLVTQDSMVIPP